MRAIIHSGRNWAIALAYGMAMGTFAQSPITLQQVVDSALKNNPRIKGAQLAVRSSEQAEGAAFSLPNPQLYTESPTADFYTIGVTQPIDFPGVYINQRKQAKAATALSRSEQVVSELELKREVHRAYNEAQVEQAEAALLGEQDSLLRSVSDAADRQFEAGQIDKVQQLFASTQYGKAHAQYMGALAQQEAALQQLRLIAGLRQAVVVVPIAPGRIPLPEREHTAPHGHAQAAQADAARALRERNWRTERSRAWPGLTVGYLNQGPVDAPVRTGLQAGITVPIWFWQYNARIKAAKSELQRAEQDALTSALDVERQSLTVQAELDGAFAALDYFNTRGLADAEALGDAARRFFEQGRTDYVNYLRTLNDAYQLRIEHLDALRRYDQALIDHNYLHGTL